MTTVALSVRILAALRAGALLAHRPRGVVHVVSGPLSPSGRWTAARARTVCHTRTRRLSVVERRGGTLDLHGRRFCRRCTGQLPPVLGRSVGRLVSRDDWHAAYSHLTTSDLMQAAAWTRTVDECHQVGYLASVVLGPGNTRPVDELLDRRRRLLAARARTPEVLEAAAARRDAEQLEEARMRAARSRAIQLDKAQERARRGSYLAPWERQLLDHPA